MQKFNNNLSLLAVALMAFISFGNTELQAQSSSRNADLEAEVQRLRAELEVLRGQQAESDDPFEFAETAFDANEAPSLFNSQLDVAPSAPVFPEVGSELPGSFTPEGSGVVQAPTPPINSEIVLPELSAPATSDSLPQFDSLPQGSVLVPDDQDFNSRLLSESLVVPRPNCSGGFCPSDARGSDARGSTYEYRPAERVYRAAIDEVDLLERNDRTYRRPAYWGGDDEYGYGYGYGEYDRYHRDRRPSGYGYSYYGANRFSYRPSYRPSCRGLGY